MDTSIARTGEIAFAGSEPLHPTEVYYMKSAGSPAQRLTGFMTGRKYPLVLYIHGGPRSASKAAFNSRAQLLAAQQWIVFEPNYRGSDNLGYRYQSAIWNDAGEGPGRAM